MKSCTIIYTGLLITFSSITIDVYMDTRNIAESAAILGLGVVVIGTFRSISESNKQDNKRYKIRHYDKNQTD